MRAPGSCFCTRAKCFGPLAGKTPYLRDGGERALGNGLLERATPAHAHMCGARPVGQASGGGSWMLGVLKELSKNAISHPTHPSHPESNSAGDS